MFAYLVITFPVILGFIILLYIVGRAVRIPELPNIFGILGVPLIALIVLLKTSTIDFIKIFVPVLVLLWSIIHSLNLFLKYKNFNNPTLYSESKSLDMRLLGNGLLRRFIFPAVVLTVVSLPVLHLINNPYPTKFGFLYIFGSLVFLGGFLIECINTCQQSKFFERNDNSDNAWATVVRKLTFYPYLHGNLLVWCGFWLMALPVIDGFYTVVSPLIVMFLTKYGFSLTFIKREDFDKKSDK